MGRRRAGTEDPNVIGKRIKPPIAPGDGHIYPWSKWMDGNWWEIERGTQFKAAILSMRNALHRAAKQKCMKVRTRSPSDNVIQFQFFVDKQEQ